MSTKTSLFLLLAFLALPLGALRADEAKDKEARLREALQNVSGQLQAAQAQNADLQAAQVASDREKDALKAQVQKLTDELKATITKSTLALQAAAAQRDQLKMQNALLQRRVEDDESKNLALFEIGRDILDHYEKFSLGDALSAKEPFTGLTRVKLENQVQGYEDKLLAQRTQTPPPDAASATPTEPTPPSDQKPLPDK